MYSRNAVLDHRPSALIVESSMPAWAADVAAPSRKLCPEYKVASKPASVNTSHTKDTNWGFVRGAPSSLQKKGPGVGPRMAI